MVLIIKYGIMYKNNQPVKQLQEIKPIEILDSGTSLPMNLDYITLPVGNAYINSV